MKHTALHKFRPAPRSFASFPFGMSREERRAYRAEHRVRLERVEMREALTPLDREQREDSAPTVRLEARTERDES